ncbi:MAG: hypothetical protein QGF21_01530 [Vicinamibacterales bacterium]|nr:hypothetical protein [Vicinamibacterales bacterium]MDP7670607.1 hypothetical protein [Vicinamibacterales bacterium]HJO39110.1 hypothetical protein [Vicinamibacterales bacterium]
MTHGTTAEQVGDRFFRELVWSLRNGVLAITRDGRVAVFNDIAYRTLGLEPDPRNLGRPTARFSPTATTSPAFSTAPSS